MKLHIVITVLIALGSLFLLNCASTEVADSQDVNQEKIYQKYTVVFDDENNELEGEAIFRFGGNKGTTLILSEPSNIKINNISMIGDEHMLRGYVYEHSNFELKTYDFEFAFKDIDENEYKNSISLYPIDKINIPDSIALFSNTNIIWIGPAIQQNEKIQIKITDKTGNEKSITSRIKGINEIIIKPEQLQTLIPGIGNLRLIRTISKNLEQSNEIGGNIYSIYYSEIYTIHIGGLPNS